LQRCAAVTLPCKSHHLPCKKNWQKDWGSIPEEILLPELVRYRRGKERPLVTKTNVTAYLSSLHDRFVCVCGVTLRVTSLSVACQNQSLNQLLPLALVALVVAACLVLGSLTLSISSGTEPRSFCQNWQGGSWPQRHYSCLPTCVAAAWLSAWHSALQSYQLYRPRLTLRPPGP
jgi:hypothetical protein